MHGTESMASTLRILVPTHPSCVGRDSVTGIATRYGLDSPGNESRWERDFPHPSSPAYGSIQPPVQWLPCVFPGGKADVASRWPPPPPSRAEPASGLSWPVAWWPLPFCLVNPNCSKTNWTSVQTRSLYDLTDNLLCLFPSVRVNDWVAFGTRQDFLLSYPYPLLFMTPTRLYHLPDTRNHRHPPAATKSKLTEWLTVHASKATNVLKKKKNTRKP